MSNVRYFSTHPATTELYTLSLHDALPISARGAGARGGRQRSRFLDGVRLGGKRDRCRDRKSTRLNSSHPSISYAVFWLKKKNKTNTHRHIARKEATAPGWHGQTTDRRDDR